jgi:hypothetical protein
MKKVNFIATLAFTSFTFLSNAQDIPQSKVPSVVVNKFQQTFPKATDVEWEMAGENYKVEFEKPLEVDHEAWFDKTGKLIRHKEEISKSKLPASILTKLKTDYNTYRVEDVKKITEGSKITYTVELESSGSEWKITYSNEGKELNKIAD